MTPGANISCTPRGGDGTSLGVQLGLASEHDDGLPAPLRGTDEMGICLNFDHGYLFTPHTDFSLHHYQGIVYLSILYIF